MRVTKLIREYVEKNVNAVYEPKIKAIGVEYQERKETLNKQLDDLVEQADASAKKMIADAGFELRYNRDCFIQSYGSVCIKKLEDENNAKRNALHAEMREKINDILLNLELGATRAELDEMIKNLAQGLTTPTKCDIIIIEKRGNEKK